MLRSMTLGLSCVVAAAPLAAQGGVVHVARELRSAGSLAMPLAARRGFWVGAGLGAGIGSGRSRTGETGKQRTAGYLRAGTTVNPTLLVGGELAGWERGGEAGRQQILSLTAGAWWYPGQHRGYLVRWGMGVSRWHASQDGQAVVSTALALIAGAGYQLRVSPGLSAELSLNALASAGGTRWLETADGPLRRRRLAAGERPLLFQLGIGLTRNGKR